MVNSRASTPPLGFYGAAAHDGAQAGGCQPNWFPNWTAEDASSSGVSWAGPNESMLTSFSSDPGPVDWQSLPSCDLLAATSLTLDWNGALDALMPIDQCPPSTAAAQPSSAETSSLPQTLDSLPQTLEVTGFENIEVPSHSPHSGSHSTDQSSTLPHLMGTSGRLDVSWAFEPSFAGPEALRLPQMGPLAEQQAQPLFETPQDGTGGHQWALPFSSVPPLPANVQSSVPVAQELLKVVQQQQAMMEAMQRQLQALQQLVMQQQQQPGHATSLPSAQRPVSPERGGRCTCGC